MSITKETRREAYYEILEEAPKRRKLIYQALVDGGPQTAQELGDRLGFSDLNAVKPRLTELRACGLVRTIGKRKNPKTGKSNAVLEAIRG